MLVVTKNRTLSLKPAQTPLKNGPKSYITHQITQERSTQTAQLPLPHIYSNQHFYRHLRSCKPSPLFGSRCSKACIRQHKMCTLCNCTEQNSKETLEHWGISISSYSSLITPCRACAARGQVIALGLLYVCKKIFETHFQKSISTQEGFSSNLMAFSTALQLGKSSWPSQILIVYRLGKASATPES